MAFDPTTSRTNFDQALRAYRAGDRAGARRHVDALLAREPKDAQARFLLEQLRRTYARRLALTQRAVMT